MSASGTQKVHMVFRDFLVTISMAVSERARQIHHVIQHE